MSWVFGTCSDHWTTGEVEKPAPDIVSGTNICQGNGITWHITNRDPTPTPPQSWRWHSQQWKFGEKLLIWTWSKCSLVEAHQAQFQPCAGAGNRERQHWVLQGQRACAPVSPHAVLPRLPEGLGTCSSNECELNDCRQEKTPLTLLRLLWKLLRASEEAAGVFSLL